MDAVKILGSLLSSGVLSNGSGSNVLGNLLGAALGGNQQANGMMGMLGSLLGGSSQASGGMGGLLGSLLGGGAQQRPAQQGGGMGDLLGSLLGGGAQQRPAQQGGGMGDLLGSLLGGGAATKGMAANGTPDLGSLLGGAMSKYLGSQNGNPQLNDLTDSFLPPQAVNQQAVQDQALLLIRTMINAAKADGNIDAQEQERILSKMGSLTADEAAFIRNEFQAPLDVAAFIRSIPAGMGQQIYTVSLMAIDLDTQQEAQYLAQLAQGLHLNAQLCNQIHEQVGAPKIFS
ncbi:tellurite resistance TerB family protein [Thiofilum flexile]|uniref:tellurite resistance TerB family protein n=1 Tax=Thiofilum flexile TaxID=125627 RepID=UPI00037DFE3A|nr:DUF533 domain-containing protein [Thiofilum flexile]